MTTYSENTELLFFYIQFNDIQSLENLLKNGSDVNSTNEYGDTKKRILRYTQNLSFFMNLRRLPLANCKLILCFAIRMKHFKIVKLLINHGADLNKTDSQNNLPLIIAINHKLHNIIELLINYGADTNPEKYGNILYIYAIRNNLPNLVELLLKHNADINKPNTCSFTPLYYAIICNVPNIVELLLKYGADTNTRDINGYTLKKYFSFHKKVFFVSQKINFFINL